MANSVCEFEREIPAPKSLPGSCCARLSLFFSVNGKKPATEKSSLLPQLLSPSIRISERMSGKDPETCSVRYGEIWGGDSLIHRTRISSVVRMIDRTAGNQKDEGRKKAPASLQNACQHHLTHSLVFASRWRSGCWYGWFESGSGIPVSKPAKLATHGFLSHIRELNHLSAAKKV